MIGLDKIKKSIFEQGKMSLPMSEAPKDETDQHNLASRMHSLELKSDQSGSEIQAINEEENR